MLVLLDRDGVINEDRSDSVKQCDELVLIDGAAEAIALLNRHDIKVAVVTNQSVVGRGIISEDMLSTIHAHLQQLLQARGAHLDAIYTCTDHPNRATHRRKPGDGMVQEALRHFTADPACTPLVGDALRDLQAAATAGCPRYLVRTGKGAELETHGIPQALAPVEVVKDLPAAVAHIMARYRI